MHLKEMLRILKLIHLILHVFGWLIIKVYYFLHFLKFTGKLIQFDVRAKKQQKMIHNVPNWPAYALNFKKS